MELNSSSRATIFWPLRDSQPDAPTSTLLPRLDANDEKAHFTQTTVMKHLAGGSGRLLCCFFVQHTPAGLAHCYHKMGVIARRAT
jgi:hypothetical protein